MITADDIKKALPANLRSAATQSLADLVNNVTTDQILAEQVRDNFISYTTVLRDGKFKMEDYLNAVVYVSHKLMGANNQDAYFKTFPQRHAALVAKGTASKDIAAYVSAYHKGKLVNLIMEQSLVPSWVLNQDIYQKAINTQAELMLHAQSEKVRCDAANSLLTHLGKPKEGTNFQINIDQRQNSGMQEIEDTLRQLAEQQQLAITNGTPTNIIAGSNLIREVVDGAS